MSGLWRIASLALLASVLAGCGVADNVGIGGPGGVFSDEPAPPPRDSDFIPGQFPGAARGTSIAVSVYSGAEPGGVLVIGEPGNDYVNEDAGAVHVYILDAMNTWQYLRTLYAPNAGAGDAFGSSVAIPTGAHVIVVGAPGEDSAATGADGDGADDSAPDSGAVYVFEDDNVVYLKPSNTGAGDRFGSAVDVEVPAFGYRVVVGAPGESSGTGDPNDDSAPGAGACYVIEDGVETAYLKAPAPGGMDALGTSVALSNGMILAGAPGDDSASTGIDGNAADDSAPDAGAAVVFELLPGGGWARTHYVKASNPEAGDGFGTAVAVYTPGEGKVLVVGAPGEDGGAAGIGGDDTDNTMPDAGAVYLYPWSSAGYGTSLYYKASNPGPRDRFGQAVAGGGGIFEVPLLLLVGAPGEAGSGPALIGSEADDALPEAGAVYAFTRAPGSTSQTPDEQRAYLKADIPEAFGGFGSAVAGSRTGSLDHVAVGAPGQDTHAGPDSGAGYMYLVPYLIGGP